MLKTDLIYWNGKGEFQDEADFLETLIPATGKVEKGLPRSVDKFRRAANVYHDLYNNGLMNRRAEFRNIFGMASTDYATGDYTLFRDELFERVESTMNELIANAFFEYCQKTGTNPLEK